MHLKSVFRLERRFYVTIDRTHESMELLPQFKTKEQEYLKLEASLGENEVLSDPSKLRKVNEMYVRMKPLMNIGRTYEKALQDLEGAEQTLKETNDEEMKAMANEEIELVKSQLPQIEKDLLIALIPPDPIDEKNVIAEIRAGAGGDESSIFAGELVRMYTMYAEARGWKIELVSANRNEAGGFKEIVFAIKGEGVYGKLKYESGVHRVQRVPETEKQGRVHTSTATVAILPEVEEEDVPIDAKDLKIEATTSTGAGGQSVNTTYSAIRITYLPTGLMVYCQDERSQKQNKERALSIIRARVFAQRQEEAQKKLDEARHKQIGTGDRSEKIRTYNFPQDRVTDHRVGESYHNIPGIMNGDLDKIFNDLKQLEINEKLGA